MLGIIVMGGLTNSVLRALERLGLADIFGASRVPMLVLNVVYPLVPEELRAFCAGKSAVLVVEEGHPEYIEQALNADLRRADIQTRVLGKGPLPKAGEYTAEVLLNGLAAFFAAVRPAGIDADAITARVREIVGHRPKAAAALGELPARPPGFCTGCPERPVFSAIKLAERELGPTHISADIGCHSFGTLPPFSVGNSILGYGMSPRERRRRRPEPCEAADRGHGRRRPVAQRAHHRRRQQSVQQGRRRPHRHAERLHLGDRPAIHAVEQGRPHRRSAGHGRRDDAARHGREVAAQGAHLWRCQHGDDAQGGDAHRRARPQGHHRRRRMPARAPAPRARRGCRQAQARRARRAHPLRRRRGHLHRRPLLHPPVGLPVADGEAQPGPAAQRSGDHGHRQLRRLRTVRRGRPCRGAVPVVLSRRSRAQSDLVGSRARGSAHAHHRHAWRLSKASAA